MNATATPAVRHSEIWVMAYAVVVAALVGSFCAGAMNTFTDHDSYTALAIGLLGLIAVRLGGSTPWVMSVGTWGAFMVLTAEQSPLIRYLAFGAVLFSIGMYGMVVSRNAVRVLMSIELMLNAVNINFVAFARYVDPANVKGQIFAIFILTVAAAEAAVGLAIVLAIYRNMATVDMDRFNLLKW